MNNETLRALLGMKLNKELKVLFIDEELSQPKDEILGDCFRINMFVVIYEILIEQMEHLNKTVLKEMLDRPDDIINQIYQSWLEVNGDDYERIKNFVKKEVA